jgi:hypothetical protein
MVQAMRSHNVKTSMIASPTKIEDYYRKHRDEFTSKEEIKLRMIMISGQKRHRKRPGAKGAGRRSARQTRGRWRIRTNGASLF